MNAATKRAERRAQNAELKAAGICIDCYDEHKTGTMRCNACRESLRGRPLIERDPDRRIESLLGMDTSAMTTRQRLNRNYRLYYWRKRAAQKREENG